MKTLARACALLFTFTLGFSLLAQVTPDTAGGLLNEAAQAQSEALRLRSEIAGTVVSKGLTPEEAISRLKAHSSPSGLKLEADAGFALAAIDVGQRIITLQAPAAAEKFFEEAEKSLEAVIKRTPDSAARDKSLFLRQIAFIRGNYLNKVAQAKVDIDQAIALLPEDKGLKRTKSKLPNDPADVLKNQPKG